MFQKRFKEVGKMTEENKIRQIMFDKLKEMAEIKPKTCMEDCDYINLCSAMNEIAKTLLDK